MSPRPRSTSDEEILTAAARVISRVGSGRFTLGDIGEEAGLSPAGLVQRFGSKGGLLLALAEHRASGVPGRFAAARELHASSLDALLHALASIAHEVDTPEALANLLAFEQMHLDEDGFHAHALRHARTMLAEIRALLDEAVEAGELAECDPDDLSRTVQTAYTGALSTWAVYRSGTLDDWLRGEVEAVLEPYRA
ncbi:MAG TPA: TetR/AcrR family transcriptional regulator [Longimicrobium sp.]|jgi:AcrR family transcriptional regulator|uniref:TetR/AcrR family transcriptional regulator n=1 Tax=Longimicrobium sp. TaxID=2029185 RepID=UPI002ED98984